MSTRAVIQIKKTTKYAGNNPNNGEHRVQYYRHWDGYTSFLGIELVKILLDLITEKQPSDFKSVNDVDFYLGTILNQQYQKEDIKDIHGDIEYFYLLDFDDGITLTRFKRTDWKKDKPENPEKWADSFVLLRASDQKEYHRLESLNYNDGIN